MTPTWLVGWPSRPSRSRSPCCWCGAAGWPLAVLVSTIAVLGVRELLRHRRGPGKPATASRRAGGRRRLAARGAGHADHPGPGRLGRRFMAAAARDRTRVLARRASPAARSHPATARGDRHHPLRGRLRGGPAGVPALDPARQSRTAIVGRYRAGLLPADGCLGVRHRCDVRRQGLRRAQARAGDLAREDPRRWRGRPAGWHGDRTAVRPLALSGDRRRAPTRPGALHRGGACGRGPARRPRGVVAQARGGGQGFVEPDSRAWWRTRPLRCPLLWCCRWPRSATGSSACCDRHCPAGLDRIDRHQHPQRAETPSAMPFVWWRWSPGPMSTS